MEDPAVKQQRAHAAAEIPARGQGSVGVEASVSRCPPPYGEGRRPDPVGDNGRKDRGMRLTERMIALEREGWEALVAGHGEAYYREHLATNAMTAFPFGVLDREAALEATGSAPPWHHFEIRDPGVVELGGNSGVIVYNVVAQRSGHEPYSAVISSTFVEDGGSWRLAFHQQSPSG